MHPVIRSFPSVMFYGDRITDGENITTRKLDPVLTKMSEKFKRVVFFDLANSVESDWRIKSKMNQMESEWTFSLLEYILKICQSNGKFFKNRIAVITPYRG